MKRSYLIGALAMLLSSCSTIALAQNTATLKMKIVVDGTAPAPQPVIVGGPIFGVPISDKLLVSEKGELANFVVMFDEEKSKLKVPAELQKSPEATHVLEITQGLFVPKVIVARPGQTITVKNRDRIGHNINFKMLKNEHKNLVVPAGQAKDYKLDPTLVEPAAMPIGCDIHPWMSAHIIVKPHPYVGVSAADGTIEIKDLPVGDGAAFRVWHEACDAIGELSVNGKAQKLTRNRWDIELKPGVNDLGVVKLDVKLLKP
jgi:plastocyanin